MKRQIRQTVAYLMIFLMFFGILPEEVMANSQASVKSGVTLVSNSSDSGYSITIGWTAPEILVNEIGSLEINGVEKNPENQYTDGYDINVENIVTGEEYVVKTVENKKNADDAGTKYSETINEDLMNGFLYRISVIPYHYHTVVVGENTRRQEAPLDVSDEDNEAFFLTDIQVEGTGEGNSMTIIWDNPSELIKKYIISYSKITDDPSQAKQAQLEVDVEAKDANLEIINDTSIRGGTRYKYTITNANVITPANMYDVVIEPVFTNGTYEDTKELASGAVLKNENEERVPVTVKTNGDQTGKYSTVVTTNLPLTIEEIDDQNIKLVWTGLDSATVAETELLEIRQCTDEDFKNYTVIGTLMNEGAKIGSWVTSKPKDVMYFQVAVSFKNKDDKKRPTMYSVIVEYNPSTIPYIPNKPDVLEITSEKEGNYKLNVTWAAFVRYPYTEKELENTENNDGATYIDRDVRYDIWLTDNAEELYSSTSKLVPILQDISGEDITKITYIDAKGEEIPAYIEELTKYVTKIDEVYSTKSLVPNKLYYMKIVAKKTFNGKEYLSKPEYKLVYFNEEGNVFTPPMISKPPLKIREDSEGKKMIEQTKVTIEWKTQWWEIYNALSDLWESKFDVVDGKLVFGADVEEDGILIKKEEDIKLKITSQTGNEDIDYRMVLLDDEIQYETMLVKYSDIENYAKRHYPESDLEDRKEREKIYDEYIKEVVLPLETSTTSLFTAINKPILDETDAQKITFYTDIENLKENTEYVILFRAYRKLEDETLLKSDPAYLTFTTLPLDKDLVEIPTVPSLYLHEKDDISITVKWRNDGFKYELAVSEKPLEDASKAELLLSEEEIEENGEKIIFDEELSDSAIYYKITGLFPDTQYYIWVRAISDTAPEPSAWSSPLQEKTKPLAQPNPPEGLGLASNESLLYVNLADNKQYIPVDSTYIIAEWMKDPDDMSEGYTSTVSDSGNGMLGAEEIKATMLAIFNDLITNRYYYIRVATRVTVEKLGELGSGTTKTFSYIVQIADNEDFEDLIQFEIPTEFALEDPADYRTEISEFSDFIKILTVPDDSEYDSNNDPDLYPLPDQDYEYVYDPKTQTLTYRIRSNKIDNTNMPDNRVDQRLITKLIKNGVYEYNIDVSSYGSKVVANREVEIPYTVFEVFKQRDIDIIIKAKNMKLVINPSCVPEIVTKMAEGYGDNSSIKVNIKQGNGGLNAFTTTNPANYLSMTQQVSMELETPKANLTIDYIASPIEVKLELANRYEVYDKNVSAYMYNQNSGKWQRVEATYDDLTAELSFDTNTLSAYTAVAIEAPFSMNSGENFKAISNKINIVDMTLYDADQELTANQLNNLIYSVATNEKDVKLNRTLTQKQKNLLSKAGLTIDKVDSQGVSTQEAVSVAVKLYEIKTGLPVTATLPKDSDIVNMAEVAAVYQNDVLKAEKIGLIQGDTIKPNENITLEEMAYMINIILEETN